MSNRIDSKQINLGESFVIDFEEGIFSSDGRKKAISEKQKKISSIIESAKQEAAAIVEEAKQKAVAEAQAAVETIQEEAKIAGYNAGYETGYNDGQNAINKDLAEKVLMVNNFTQSNFEVKKRIIKSAHLDMLKLIMKISDKICHKKLEQDEEILDNIIKSAVALLPEKEEINIITNPSMYKCVKELTDKLVAENNLISSIKLMEDSAVSADGVIIEGVQGRVDSRISSQIEEMTEKLLNGLQFIPEDDLVAEASVEETVEEVQSVTEEQVEEVVEPEIQAEIETPIEQKIIEEPEETEITDNQGQDDDSVQ